MITAENIKELRERTGVGMGKCKQALEEVGGDMEKAIDYLRKMGMASAVKKEGRETKEGVVVCYEGSKALALLEVNSETDFVAQNDKFKAMVQGFAEDIANSMPASLEAFMKKPCAEDSAITNDDHRAIVMQSLGENIQVKRLKVVPKNSDHSYGIYSHMGGKILCVVELSGGADNGALAKDIAMHVAAESPEYLSAAEVPSDVKAREEDIARGQMQGKPENMMAKIVEGKLKAFYDQVCLNNQKYVKNNSLTITQLLQEESKKKGKEIAVQVFYRWNVGGA